MPDEYLPPNKILFLQNLPESVSKPQLEALFSQCVEICWTVRCFDLLLIKRLFRYPNLLEVRLIPTKKDIAFVEYLDEGSATTAKDALHNYKLDGDSKIKVIYYPFPTRIQPLILHRLLMQGSDHYILPTPLGKHRGDTVDTQHDLSQLIFVSCRIICVA